MTLRWMLSLAAICAACPAPVAPHDAGPTSDGDFQLASCVIDLWLAPTAADCACTDIAEQPECSEDDCRRYSFYWFTGDHLREGFLLASSASGTTSSYGPVVSSTYSVRAGTLAVEDGTGERLECGEADLTYGLRRLARAPPGMADAIAPHLPVDGPASWFGITVPQPP